MIPFQIHASQGLARTGTLSLLHGKVETPVFMPVGTYGVVRTVSPAELNLCGAQIILGNAFHLFLRPGLETLNHFGGLHSFMGWNAPILTDSGGFQVFSLDSLKSINDNAVTFRSPLNGDLISFTPELSAEIQRTIGSDIAMVLDECVALPNTKSTMEMAVERSLNWAKRFLSTPRLPGQLVFGIAQGGCDLSLRQKSLEETCSLSIDGIAVGGLSVGEPLSAMLEVLDFLSPKLPPALPHYLMGVGTPRDILESVARGIDMFDCVLPTRNARNGAFFTDSGLLNIRNAKYRLDSDPIDPSCTCECCQNYTRGYLRHLFSLKEILACRLATLHNLHYYQRLLGDIRAALRENTFPKYYQEMSEKLAEAYPGDDDDFKNTCAPDSDWK